MSDKITERIIRDLGISNLTEALSELSGSDLHSLLVTVLKNRIAKIEPAKLASINKVTQSCNLDARLLNEVERLCYETALSFEATDLSPLAPLGTLSTLTGLDQGNILSTIRAFECACDPTIGLALECAQRRKSTASRKEITRLCTSQRVVRFPVPEQAEYTAHFKLFALVSAARDTGSFLFETIALSEHIRFYLSLLSKLITRGFAFKDISVEISDTHAIAHLCSMFGIDRDEIKMSVRARDSASSDKLLEKHSVSWPKKIIKPSEELVQFDLPKQLMTRLCLLEENVCAPLSVEYKNICFSFNMQRLTGLGYYDGPCFHIKMTNENGRAFMLIDGGFVSWTKLLLCDNKERLMTSAIGIELMCRMFRDSQDTRDK